MDNFGYRLRVNFLKIRIIFLFFGCFCSFLGRYEEGGGTDLEGFFVSF